MNSLWNIKLCPNIYRTKLYNEQYIFYIIWRCYVMEIRSGDMYLLQIYILMLLN